jgi:hypothetical protein
MQIQLHYLVLMLHLFVVFLFLLLVLLLLLFLDHRLQFLRQRLPQNLHRGYQSEYQKWQFLCFVLFGGVVENEVRKIERIKNCISRQNNKE